MKNRNIILLFLAGLFLTAGSCCKNNDCNEEPKDYRDKWVGDWDFVTVITSIPPQQNITRDTICYSGKIYKVEADNELMIKYMETNSIKARVDEGGKLSDLHTSGSFNEGKFMDTNLIYISLWYGGAHYGRGYFIKGVKKRKEIKNEE